ncbi:MAG: LemA family protein, partial [Verrucomicrobiia bacterium]
NHAVIGVVEKYPELKSDEAFQKLQRELADTENRVALARDYFNNIATHYNTRIQQVPDSQVAAMGSMKPRPLLSAMDFERKSIKIDFAT